MACLRRLAAVLTFLLAASPSATWAAEPATVTVAKIKDLNIRIYGFLETNVIADSREGFTEAQANTLVPRATTSTGADSFPGKHGRTQMSVRDSRLGFDLTLPKTASGLAAEGVLELDGLANNAPNTSPGSSPGAQTERDFFNNPALRIRHAYASLTSGSWNAKLGQTWSLLGWQPYYFTAEPAVPPGVGMLFNRFTQARATWSKPFGDGLLEAAADAARPAEMNSGLTEFHGGLRLSSTKVKAAMNAGAGGSMGALSIAVSGAHIPVRTDAGNDDGQALAVDFFLPILASKDGQDRSNNLSLTGEALAGAGVAGLEYVNLNFGVGAVTASTHTGTALDSGLAGLNNDGNVELVRVQAARLALQYTFPDPRWAMSLGYAQVEALNLDRFSNAYAGNGGGLGFAPRLRYGYASLFWDPAPWFRVGAEASRTEDTYNDPANRTAVNNRFQLTSYLVF